MADELQGLIDRIQKDGVDKAEAAAADIVAKAKAQAADLVRAAEAKAQAIVKKAEADSEVYTQRSSRTLEQAARDIVLLVGGGVTSVVESLLGQAVSRALTADTLKDLLTRLIQAYAQRGMSESRVEMLLSAEDQAALKQFVSESLRQELTKGLTVGADSRIKRGFTISLEGGRVRHDFTDQAIAESLAEFLRPALADLVRAAVANMTSGSKTDSGKK
jgi:V/A-type H+-transporting ATPase subunit E